MMNRGDNPKNLIQSQRNSSNVNISRRSRNENFVLPKICPQNGEKSIISSISRLPVRSRSMTERANNLQRIPPPLPKAKFESTSDLSNHSGKVRSSSISISRIVPISAKEISKKGSTNGTQCIFKFPTHRNNSSCVGSIKLCNKNSLKSGNMVTVSKENLIDVRKSDGKSCILGSNHSIFKFFKLKVNSYREKNVENKEVTPLESVGKKIVENKVHKRSTINILENPKTKDFLIKLYNECKKLNGNITKLYSDTSHRHGRVKDVLDKHKSEKEKMDAVNRRSRSSININLHALSKGSQRYLIDQKKSDSDASPKKDNEGHYYHLACVLSPDLVNTSTKQTKNLEENNDLKLNIPTIIKEKGRLLCDEVTNISSVKSNVSVSLSTSVINRNGNDLGKKSSMIKNKCTITNEFDDTLCDLDEDMQTDSSEASKVDPNEIKSPVSNYVTANDLNVYPDPKNKDSMKVSSSLELPPVPSSRECELSDSLIKIDPPQSINDLGGCCPETAGTVSKFITVFEKQFPQRFVLRQSTTESCNDDRKEPFSNFSSSITVNCSKFLKKSVNNMQSYKLFNPFKPPKCHSFKLNTNNNNLSKDVDESDGKTNEIADEIVDNSGFDKESFKRVAPMKKLMQHSRTSEQMDEVISLQRNEAQETPVVNSCIEKQRQKKLARQQEQHQKAKDMAIEAARVRKERQQEMNTLDNFDSSRIVEKLFTDNNDDDFPDFSLFDAVHYNFQNKKPRNPRPLAQSTITGILPEGDPEEPEPPKSPLTTEKFRNQPFKAIKKIRTKKEIDKEVLAKYESINTVSSLLTPKENLKEAVEIKKDELSTSIKDKHVAERKTKKRYSSSSSNSSDTSTDSLTSLSVSSTSSSSYFSSPTVHLKKKHRYKAQTQKKKVVNKRLSSGVLQNELRVDEMNRLEISPKFGNEVSRVKEQVVAFREDFGCKRSTDMLRETKDMNVGTEANGREDAFAEERVANEKEIMKLSNNPAMKASLPEKIECHLNFLSKYKDNVMDRTLPLNINIPIPNTSLSSFVEELNTQLRSLADTVDILLQRMDILEVNILDCSKYFV